MKKTFASCIPLSVTDASGEVWANPPVNMEKVLFFNGKPCQNQKLKGFFEIQFYFTHTDYMAWVFDKEDEANAMLATLHKDFVS